MDRLTGALALVASLAVAAMIWWPVRAVIAQQIERAFEERYPRNAQGYIIGAEPLLLKGTRPGAVLLLHGFNDSPQAMASMATALHTAGWTVRVPALPGHARTLEAFARSGATDWESAARAELHCLQAAHRDVAVCGMSMGGALALLLAAEVAEVRAAVAFAPYLHRSPALIWLRLVGPLAALGARWVASGGQSSIRDPVAAQRIIAYRMATPRLLRELARVTRDARDALPRVRQPVLVLQSSEDIRIPAASAERAFTTIGSSDKTLEWLSGTGHVISVDFGHEAVERRVVEWLGTRLA